jgi:hypothetical protein
MFGPREWISISEVFWNISRVMQENGEYRGVEFFGDENFEMTWLTAVEAKEIAVCLSDGSILAASRELIDPINVYDNLNNHIDLMVGTVGSAHSEKHSENPFSQNELLRRYGPFLHLPVLLPRDEFMVFFDGFELHPDLFIDTSRSLEVETAYPKNLSARAMAKEIVAAFDSGSLQSFESAKENIGPNMSFRQFRFAWNLAKEERPEISKPGRKPKSNNS